MSKDKKHEPKERHRTPYYRLHSRDERRRYPARYFFGGEGYNLTFEQSFDVSVNTKVNLMYDSVFNTGINEDEWDNCTVNNQHRKANGQCVRNLNKKRHLIDAKQ